MVIVKVMGGLGNQLFQYAFGKSIELRCAFEVKYDISYYEKTPEGDTQRELHINQFIPKDKVATKEEVEEIVGYDKRLINRVLKKIGLYTKRIRYEKSDNIQSIEQVTDNSYLVGYWQSETYFKDCAEQIRTWFDFSEFNIDKDTEQILNHMKENKRNISIHVRGGDYLLKQNQIVFGNICTSDYYQKAYQYAKEQYPEAKCYLFTNDIEWSKQHIDLPYDEMVLISDYIEGKEDWVELYLMSQCNINIIANSSYSWWAAWLNNHKDKVVICPARWTNRSTDDRIICVDWLRIDEV